MPASPLTSVPASPRSTRSAGFETYLVEDVTRGIDAGGSLARAVADMEAAGVRRVTTEVTCHGRS